MRILSVRLVFAGLLLAGCASSGAMSGAASTGRDPNIITQAELANENFSNVYDAIQHLRPEMLRPRLANSSSSISSSEDYTVHVYMDNSRLGEIADLRNIPLVTVKEVRYLNPSQAMQRFGSGNPGGVIVLTSR
ncbi:MAG: hypothetical protein ACREN3_00610 [Gemmatimonadaceae bacterium]